MDRIFQKEVERCKSAGEPPPAPLSFKCSPEIAAWLDRMAADPQFEADEVERIALSMNDIQLIIPEKD